MRAPDLYKLAKRELGPELASLGFKRMAAGSGASWYRREPDAWLIMAFLSDPGNYPFRGGYRFTIELRLSPELLLWDGGPMARFTELLTSDAREELRWLENATIAHLPPPGPDAYLADWQLIPRPYRPNEDVWFRQAGEPDALEPMRFVRENLRLAIDAFIRSAAEALKEDPAARSARLAEARAAALGMFNEPRRTT